MVEGGSVGRTAVGPKVFVSYAHDDVHHKEAVLAFARLLVTCGIDVEFDEWRTDRRQDWYSWALCEIRDADFVVVVASPRYREVGDGGAPADLHRNVQAEARVLRDFLLDDYETWMPKVLPVVLPGGSVGQLPLFVQSRAASHYLVTSVTQDGIEDLLRVVTAQPRHVPPAPGAVPYLPPVTADDLGHETSGVFTGSVTQQHEVVVREVDQQRRRLRAVQPGVMADHPGASTLVNLLMTDDAPQVVVVHGRAGAGKSNVAYDALETLIGRGWVAGLVRMDTLQQDSLSARTLGAEFGMSDSPITVVDAVAGERPQVLVVDQLDAVSMYSGRLPDNYDAVMEMLEQAEARPHLKIVLVVRTVDLDTDPRMRHLRSSDRIGRMTVHELTPEAVCDALTAGGVDPSSLQPETLDLLRTPVHFAIFDRLDEESKRRRYHSQVDLYEQFTKQVRHVIHDKYRFDMNTVLADLVQYLSDHELLQAPKAVLDNVPASHVAALVSAGVLSEDRDGLGLVHETYFDFQFARVFVAQRNDLHRFLIDSGQHLFRRAQTRQVLQYLAGSDRHRFREVVVELLSSQAVRSHLKDVVIGVLSQLVDATAADWAVLQPLALADTGRAAKLWSLLSLPAWFDAVDGGGRWERLLADTSTVGNAAHQLITVSRERPARAMELVRPYIGVSAEWNQRLRALAQWSPTPGLAPLIVELLDEGLLDDVRGPIAVNSDFWSIAYGLKEEPDAAVQVVGAYLRRAQARAREQGVADPFRAGLVTDTSSSGGSTVLELAKAAPKTFLREILPVIVDVAKATGSRTRPNDLLTDPHWSSRLPGSSHTVTSALFAGVESALQVTAHEQAPGGPYLAMLTSSELEPLRFLACRTYTAAGEPAANRAIDWLLSDQRNLELGWAGSARWASHELIKEATKACDDGRLNALCSALLDYYPDWELSARARGARGYSQYGLLSAVDATRRPAACHRRLAELQRKFANDTPGPPHTVRAAQVRPPISDQSAQKMSDAQWLRAIEKYNSDRPDYSQYPAAGGAHELAGVLGRQAQNQPERFARLALTFGANVHPTYVTHVLDAVAKELPLALLVDLCRHVRDVAGSAGGRTVCRAIETVAEHAPEDLVELLEHFATDVNPDHERSRPAADQGLLFDSHELQTQGMNCVRGITAETIADVLFSQPHHADRLLPTIAALAHDPNIAVRTQTTIPLTALLNTHPDVALDHAQRLFDEPDIDIYASEPAMRLLTYAVLRAPNRFAPHLTRAINGPKDIAKRAGFIWVVALINERMDPSITSDPATLPPATRAGVASTLANEPDLRPNLLITLFDDPEEEVRDAAARCFYQLNETQTATCQAISTAFVTSQAFTKHFNALFHALADDLHITEDVVLDACRRAVVIAGTDLGDLRTARAAASRDLVTVVLRLYRQSGPSTRTQCLDAIDQLSDLNAYGLDTALRDER